MASLRLAGTREDGATACQGEPPGGWAALVPATLAPFGITFSADPESPTTAACTDRHLADVFLGTRTGDHLEVATTTDGAVLGGCSPTCAAQVEHRITGDLVRGPDGQVTGFTGELAEIASLPASADPKTCAPCLLPCTARYTLTTAP
jgi:hypothetical protein